MASKVIPLNIISAPALGESPILSFPLDAPDILFASGKGDTDYVCGNCRVLMCKNVSKKSISHLVFKCPTCGEYNRAL